MRKVKKINGYLVVRFNEREKQGYPQLGSFGVIDAEMYTGCIDTDLGAMEYEDADTLEVAVEQARGLESEQDYSGDPPVCTLIVEAADETTLTVHLTAPAPSLLNDLAGSYPFGMMGDEGFAAEGDVYQSAGALAEPEEENGFSTLGTGMWKLKTYVEREYSVF